MGRRVRSVVLCLATGLFSTGCADLVVREAHYGQFTTSLLLMKCTVANEGWKAAPASVTSLEVRQPPSTSFVQKATFSTPPINSGQQLELPIWPFPPTELPPQGQCMEVRICADSTSAVNEGWFFENNNCLLKSFCR